MSKYINLIFFIVSRTVYLLYLYSRTESENIFSVKIVQLLMLTVAFLGEEEDEDEWRKILSIKKCFQVA